jgi:hypothetical protein
MVTTLPGGGALRGGTCGILLGALVAVGLKYGSVIRDKRKQSKELGLHVHDSFLALTQKRYGSTDCRDISGCDFNNPEEAEAYYGSEAHKRCAELIAETVRFVLPLLEDSQVAN